MNNNPTTLTKILNGINNTLNIANKVVPLYKEAKPIFNTVTTTYKTIKENGKDIPKLIKLMKVKNELKKDININSNNSLKDNKLITNNFYNNTNNPTFFV